MANVSFSLTRGTDENKLATGVQTVTEATSAPGAGDLELRLNQSQNWTKREIKEAMDVIYRFLSNPNNSISIPL